MDHISQDTVSTATVGRAKVRRNLFGKSDDSNDSWAAAWDSATLAEGQSKFCERWGFDVTTDSAIPDGPFDWELQNFDELPEALRRIGGYRPRRCSTASIGSTEDGCYSRSGSFSIVADDTVCIYEENNHDIGIINNNNNNVHTNSSLTTEVIPLTSASTTPKTAGTRASLITDYLPSQAKRTRNGKGAHYRRPLANIKQ